MMKKGLCHGGFPQAWSLERGLAVAKEAGLDGVELNYGLEGLINPAMTAADVAAVRAAFARAGLELTSLLVAALWKFNLLSANPQERATAQEHMRNALRLAHELGAGAILVVPGFVGPFEAGAPVVDDYEAAYERGLAAIREVIPDAERYRVDLGIENVWNKFLTSPLEMRQFIDAVGSPYARAYFDVGNSLRTGYPEHWIKILGRRLCRIHFKDFRVTVGSIRGFVNLLDGDVNFGAVMAALRQAGYEGWVIGELGFGGSPLPEKMIQRAARDMDAILGL